MSRNDGDARRPWQGDDIGYRAAYERVTTARGIAAEHNCAFCADQALSWLCIPTANAPTAVATDGRYAGLAYSIDPNHYVATCQRCLARLDPEKPVARCREGHERTPQNTRTDARTGAVNCLTCDRARIAERDRLVQEARELLGMTKRQYLDRFGPSAPAAQKIITKARILRDTGVVT